MSARILYTADLHGNKKQYQKLFNYAKKTKPDAIIIGGDITPKDPKLRTIELQKAFLKNFLLASIKKFNETNPETSVMLIMGNDDFKANYFYLKENEKKFKYIVLDNKPIKWKAYFVIGYSYVPYTPFKYKDWEKADLIDEKETDRKDIILSGIKSTNNGFIKHNIDLDQREDSIEQDLNNILKEINATKTIMVVHTPPHNTSLDLIHDGRHVGSKALKKIIEEKQPALTLHGHIHESVKVSGKFIEKIGNTISISPGNDHLTEQLVIIEINTEKISKTKRIII